MRARRTGLALLVLVIAISALPAPVAWATGTGGDAGRRPRRVTEGTLLWRTAQQETPMPAPVLTTDVEMRVTGVILRATVRQEFANPSSEWAEGVYVFPLPEDAAVDHLRMRIGDRIIEGVIQERAAMSVPADRDFELVWQPVAGAAPEAALLAEQKGDEVFALLMVLPPGPTALERLRVPREVIFVLDNSGSMSGASIEQAKAALRLALARLKPADTFNVVRFNHRTDSLFLGAQPANPQNVQAAERYVGGIRADGGTEMLPALLRALDGQEQQGRLRQAIFLTDGAVGNEEQLFRAIHERLGPSRLFTIGIGSAPNSHAPGGATRPWHVHLHRQPGRGAAEDGRAVPQARVAALTDLQLELPGAGDAEVLPSLIPDLYLGEPVVVTLRTRMEPSRAVLRGRFGSTPWEHEVSLHRGADGAGLAAHWARAKIAALLDQRRSGAPDDAVRRAVIDVALRHHLVSPYTSLVAVDVTPVRPGDASLHTHALKTNLPAGWDCDAVFGLGQGATAGPLHIVLGLCVVLLAAALHVGLRRDVTFALRRRGRHAT